MIFRIRFAKYGVVKFIGHLDVMRYFQKAVRRSMLPIKYSQGFNPHQLMVFAQPLGVGVTSDGEYMDIETEDADSKGNPMSEEIARTMLSSALTEGFEIVSLRQIPWDEGTKHPENAMALIAGADYMVSLKDGYSIKQDNTSGENKLVIASKPDAPDAPDAPDVTDAPDAPDVTDAPDAPDATDATDAATLTYLKEKFAAFISEKEIVINKKTKSGEKMTDIKPYIYASGLAGNEEIPEGFGTIGTMHADIYTPGIRFFLRLSAGSVVNIKP
jgi:uncharacterized protein (DUF2344 family)